MNSFHTAFILRYIHSPPDNYKFKLVLANDPIDPDRSKNENGSIEMDRSL